MVKSKLAYIVDEFAIAFAIWLLFAVSLGYALNGALSMLISVIPACATLLVARKLDKKRHAKHISKQTVDLTMAQLCVQADSVTLHKLAEKLGCEIRDCVCIGKHTAIAVHFNGALTLARLACAYSISKDANVRLLILCNECNQETQKYLAFIDNCSVITKHRAYEFLSKLNLLPQVSYRKRRPKITLSSAKSKAFLFSAVALSVTAAFSPYALICIVAAAANLTLAILCKLKS